jgi:hypothetical protein
MACGTPAFVSDHVGAGPDLVADPECTFPVGDVPSLAAMMRRASADPEWRAALKRTAVARIKGWGLDATADAVLAGVELAMRRGRGRETSAARPLRVDSGRSEGDSCKS